MHKYETSKRMHVRTFTRQKTGLRNVCCQHRQFRPMQAVRLSKCWKHLYFCFVKSTVEDWTETAAVSLPTLM